MSASRKGAPVVVPTFRGYLDADSGVYHVEPEPVELVELDALACRIQSLASQLCDLSRDIDAAELPRPLRQVIAADVRGARKRMLYALSSVIHDAEPYREAARELAAAAELAGTVARG